MVLCGISSPFEKLSPAKGQITRALLTRAPLYSPEGFRARLACVKHAASVRSEPGSNSPVESLVMLAPQLGRVAPSAVRNVHRTWARANVFLLARPNFQRADSRSRLARFGATASVLADLVLPLSGEGGD